MAGASKTRKPTKSSSGALSGVSILFILAGAFCALALCIITVRLVWVQIVVGPTIAKEAEDARTRAITIPAQRGGIFDRDGQPLATSMTVYDVVIDPMLVAHKGKLAVMLAEVVGGDPAQYYVKMLRPSHYAIVAKRISDDQHALLKKRIAELPGETAQQRTIRGQFANLVTFELDYVRKYPLGSLAAQLIGFVQPDEKVGKAGLELRYDELLVGKPGSSTSERDVFGNLIPSGTQVEIPPVAGQSIMLTIDAHIQAEVERELAAAAKRHKAVGGWAIVMDPRNGEVYASASYPTFNLNKYSKAKPEQFRNRALTDLYEPGSTMKCVTASGVIQSGKVTAKTIFTVPDSLRVGSRTVRDSHPHATGKWTFSKIIEQSSNVGTTKAAQKLGNQGLYDTFKQFNLLEKPQTDYPGITYGRVLPTSAWSDVTLSNTSFGQGISVTPVHMVQSYATIANKGVMAPVHFLKDIPENPSYKASWKSEQILSPENAAEINKILGNVMTVGTGKDIKVNGFTVAGKTGTAQKALPGKGYVGGKYIGSFIGYLPADNPQLLVFIALDEPKAGYYGGAVAGPTFARIASFAAAHLELSPNDAKKADATTKGTATDKSKKKGD